MTRRSEHQTIRRVGERVSPRAILSEANPPPDERCGMGIARLGRGTAACDYWDAAEAQVVDAACNHRMHRKDLLTMRVLRLLIPNLWRPNVLAFSCERT
jgi:hypothetical protein